MWRSISSIMTGFTPEVGLVQQHEPRPAHQHRGELEQLALPERELRRPAIGRATTIRTARASRAPRSDRRPLICLRPSAPSGCCIATTRFSIKVSFGNTRPAGRCATARTGTGGRDRAGERRARRSGRSPESAAQVPGHHVEQRRLARAVGADQRGHGPRPNAERASVDGRRRRRSASAGPAPRGAAAHRSSRGSRSCLRWSDRPDPSPPTAPLRVDRRATAPADRRSTG